MAAPSSGKPKNSHPPAAVHLRQSAGEAGRGASRWVLGALAISWRWRSSSAGSCCSPSRCCRSPDAIRISRNCGRSPGGSAGARSSRSGVLLATGSAMATHYRLWSDGTLQLKLVLVALLSLLVIWHLRRPTMHLLEAAIFLVSLVIAWLGLTIAQG